MCYERAFTITDLTPDVLFTYVRNKSFNEGARKQLEQIANLKQQIASGGREIQSFDSQITDLVNDQERVRRNIGSLNQVSGSNSRCRVCAAAGDQEAQLASLRDRRAELDKSARGWRRM